MNMLPLLRFAISYCVSVSFCVETDNPALTSCEFFSPCCAHRHDPRYCNDPDIHHSRQMTARLCAKLLSEGLLVPVSAHRRQYLLLMCECRISAATGGGAQGHCYGDSRLVDADRSHVRCQQGDRGLLPCPKRRCLGRSDRSLAVKSSGLRCIAY